MAKTSFQCSDSPSSVVIRYWSSQWGTEWEPHVVSGDEALSLVADTGRSSEKFHPFIVFSDSTHSMAIAIPWSGNWSLVAAPASGSIAIEVTTDGDPVELITANTDCGDWQCVTDALLQRYRSMFPASKKPTMLTEWNHWWPYEGNTVNEFNFLRNAAVAAECGLEVALLDSGWFGDGDWEDARGDWEIDNPIRFPSGIARLSNSVREIGIEFGIWIEIETVGNQSKFAVSHPNFIATRDGISLETVCLANPEAYAWATRMLFALIESTQPVWIKFDFNKSPMLGCNEPNHGHDSATGHALHVRNFYRLLDEVGATYPNITLENCSSGGLRWDYGVAPHVDFGFTSDRDWPEHALCIFWAAAHFFPVESLLSWCDSEWLNEQPNQEFAIKKHSDTQHLEFILAVSLLGGFGLSQRLEDFTPEQRKVLKFYVDLYKKHFRPRYQNHPSIRFLSDQPLRDGKGDRTVAFVLDDQQWPAVVAIYQLPGAYRERLEVPVQHDGNFRIRNLVTGKVTVSHSHQGALGIHFEPRANTAVLLEIQLVS